MNALMPEGNEALFVELRELLAKHDAAEYSLDKRYIAAQIVEWARKLF